MNTEFAKHQMIAQQLRPSHVSDPAVLEALRELARDHFVPADYQHLAFADTEIPLPNGQKMMTPMVEANMLQALQLKPQHQVLEIGTGSGFVTACLGRLTEAVTSIDIFPDLISGAQASLDDAGVSNATLLCMDATAELPPEQFDAVAVTASMPRFDDRFLEVLKPGGHLFVVVGEAPVMEAQLVTRIDEMATQVQSLFETNIAALVNVAAAPVFRF